MTDARGITFEARGWIEKPCREEDTVVELRRQLQPGERWGAWERVSLAPSLELVNHSPAGFAWGYAGSGPSQLALALLYAATGDRDFAVANHQAFKFEVVARLVWPDPWEIHVDVARWAVASTRVASDREPSHGATIVKGAA